LVFIDSFELLIWVHNQIGKKYDKHNSYNEIW
jgi:hypothetical protein